MTASTYKHRHRKQLAEKQRLYWASLSPEERKRRSSSYHEKVCSENPGHNMKVTKRFRQKNPQAARTIQNRYKIKKYHADPQVKIKGLAACTLYNAVNKPERIKAFAAEKMLGCSVAEFMRVIESKFKPGMTWENRNYHGWQFDHIKPCCSFDLTDQKQYAECFHFSNYQPLWGIENRKKHAEYERRKRTIAA